jgi:hypothetical protein
MGMPKRFRGNGLLMAASWLRTIGDQPLRSNQPEVCLTGPFYMLMVHDEPTPFHFAKEKTQAQALC